jgi:hypothetical protein
LCAGTDTNKPNPEQLGHSYIPDSIADVNRPIPLIASITGRSGGGDLNDGFTIRRVDPPEASGYSS